jgi:hypothetical protein
VDRRLEEIFGDKDHPPVPAEKGDDEGPGEIQGSDPDGTMLRELKATALSLDWEITNETLDRFVDGTQRLRERYEHDSNVSLLLQLLGSLGKYIKSNKSRSHPDSVRLLNRIFNSLERVISRDDLTEEDKQHILLRRIKEFRKLKEEVASGRFPRSGEKRQAPEEMFPKEREDEAREETHSPSDEMKGMMPHEAFAYALEEIKQVIKAEFKALRAELRLWRGSK